MEKIVKIAAIVLFVMAVQGINAQQNQVNLQAKKWSSERHKKLDDETAQLNEEQKAMEFKKSLSNYSAADQKGIEERISQIKEQKQALEAKNRKLVELESVLNTTNEKLGKLKADQDAEYKKNGLAPDDENIRKQRAAAKDNLNNLQQLQYDQQAEIEKVMNTP